MPYNEDQLANVVVRNFSAPSKNPRMSSDSRGSLTGLPASTWDTGGSGQNNNVAQWQKVGPAGYCQPRHPTHFEPSSLELNCTL